MDQHGYVMIRNLLSSDDLNPLLRDVAEVLRDAGWLGPNSNPIDRIANAAVACADGDPAYRIIRDKVFGLQSFHALPHLVVLQEVMKLLVAEQLLIHPKSEAKLIFPNFERGIIHAHQDHAAVAGDEATFTAWIVLHDCPPVLGPLRILDGSHRFGLQPTTGETGYIPSGTERGEDSKGGEINRPWSSCVYGFRK